MKQRDTFYSFFMPSLLIVSFELTVQLAIKVEGSYHCARSDRSTVFLTSRVVALKKRIFCVLTVISCADIDVKNKTKEINKKRDYLIIIFDFLLFNNYRLY